MGNIKLKSLLFGLLLSAACQAVVDPDPRQLGEDALKTACEGIDCKEGTHCALVEVQCVQAPCERVAECVPDELEAVPLPEGQGQACGKNTCAQGQVCCNASCGICTEPGGVCIQLACDEGDDDNEGGTDKPTCAATTCPVGQACVEGPGGAECKDPDGAANCAATLCLEGTYCDDISGQAKCIPLPSCKDMLCKPGTHCELQEVQCVRAPCPPQPTCVRDSDPCAVADCAGDCMLANGKPLCLPLECKDPCQTVKCGKGMHCEPLEVQCFTTPCCPVAQCVADGGQACGANTCGAGTYCCNPSCGICAPKGGVCTQQLCK